MPYLLPFTMALRAQPGPTCLLGLGGGAVLHVAAPHLTYSPITAVEINAEVIALSRQFFWLNSIPLLTVVHEEAHNFLGQNQTHFKHILIDLYADTGFPKNCTQTDFFDQCKQSLHKDGFLALNLVNLQRELSILDHVKTIFPQATLCIPVPYSSNMIVLASHSKETLLSLIYSAPNLKTFIWDSVFGYMAKFS